MVLRVSTLVMAFAAVAVHAEAHHEALFGPQSALALSGEKIFSAQVFTRQTGPRNERVQETTTVLSTALSPTTKPISLSIVVPFSVIAAGSHGGTRVGVENAIVAARYRVDLPGVARALGSEESYMLGVGGIEAPTGTIDHRFGDGAPALVAAGCFSLERRPFSMIGYGFVHHFAVRHGLRESGNRYLGGGIAWTPIDREEEGRLFSLQFGLSHETTFQEVFAGTPRRDTGGWALMAHPTVVWATSPHVLLYAVTSVPLADRWNNSADRERFRLGTGAMVRFGR